MKNRCFIFGWVISFALVLSGCAVGPDYIQPDVPKPQKWIEEKDPVIKAEPADFGQWWMVFNDPVLNTLVGHLWGYYAALAINEGSRFLYHFQEKIQRTLADSADQGLDIYELVLEKSFRQEFAAFYGEFRQRKTHHRLPAALGRQRRIVVAVEQPQRLAVEGLTVGIQHPPQQVLAEPDDGNRTPSTGALPQPARRVTESTAAAKIDRDVRIILNLERYLVKRR